MAEHDRFTHQPLKPQLCEVAPLVLVPLLTQLTGKAAEILLRSFTDLVR
jgi:hypothetical protein